MIDRVFIFFAFLVNTHFLFQDINVYNVLTEMFFLLYYSVINKDIF